MRKKNIKKLRFILTKRKQEHNNNQRKNKHSAKQLQLQKIQECGKNNKPTEKSVYVF